MNSDQYNRVSGFINGLFLSVIWSQIGLDLTNSFYLSVVISAWLIIIIFGNPFDKQGGSHDQRNA